MTKVIVEEFHPTLYPYRLWIVKGVKPDSWISDRFCWRDGSEIRIDDPTVSDAITYGHIVEKDGGHHVGTLVVLYEKSAYCPGVIAHEAVHVTNRIFEYTGIKYSWDNDEHFAYLLKWVVDCMWAVVTGKTKK